MPPRRGRRKSARKEVHVSDNDMDVIEEDPVVDEDAEVVVDDDDEEEVSSDDKEDELEDDEQGDEVRLTHYFTSMWY